MVNRAYTGGFGVIAGGGPSPQIEPPRPGLPMRMRVLGLVPLAVFLTHFCRNWQLGQPESVFWMCHVSNALLAAGMLAACPGLIRLAVIWLLPAIPLWIMYTIQTRDLSLITCLTHVLSPAIGLTVLRKTGAARWTWLWAFVWFLFIQQLTRMFTPPELNINVAHTIYAGWDRIFSAYWQYWLFTTSGSAVILWLMGRGLLWFAPPRQHTAEG